MTRITPPRPLDIEAVFPELRAHRGTTTRLHPRPGRPGVRDSSVGGPLRWPREEPWPVCPEAHGSRRGRRPADIHRARRVLAGAWSRAPAHGPTDEERRLLGALREEHRAESAPVPLVGLAQLYRRDVPDLLPGPGGRDLLQVLWCPFDAHGASGYEPFLDVRWRYSAGTGDADVRTDPPPTPQVVGHDGYVPEPCVLHPEQVTTCPFAGSLPAELRARLDAWDEENDAADEEDDGAPAPAYQYDLSIPPGRRAGGFASWHTTDPYPMNCARCRTPLRLLLTVDTTEWDGGSGSWRPVEEPEAWGHALAAPTQVVVGRWGELNLFACPADPAHPHAWSIQ